MGKGRAVQRAACRRAPRRCATRPAAQHRFRTCRRSDQDDASHQASRWFDALARGTGDRRDRHIQSQRAALLSTVWPAASSHRGASSCPTTFVSSRRCVTWLASTSARRAQSWSSVSMRGVNARRWSAPNRSCIWASATPRASSRLQATWRENAVRCPQRDQRSGASLAAGSRSSCRSCARSTRPVPAVLDIHCIVENYATHSHLKVKARLAMGNRTEGKGQSATLQKYGRDIAAAPHMSIDMHCVLIHTYSGFPQMDWRT